MDARAGRELNLRAFICITACIISTLWPPFAAKNRTSRCAKETPQQYWGIINKERQESCSLRLESDAEFFAEFAVVGDDAVGVIMADGLVPEFSAGTFE